MKTYFKFLTRSDREEKKMRYTRDICTGLLAICLVGFGLGNSAGLNDKTDDVYDIMPGERTEEHNERQLSCPAVNAGIVPVNSPPWVCGPPGPAAMDIMADINAFWQSQMVLCVCGQDLGGCLNNALVFDIPSGGFGYIYFDPNFLFGFLTQFGSFMPPAMVLAHEAGHNIQNAFGIAPPTAIQRELGADCLAGFYLGAVACTGRIREDDIEAALLAACQSGDRPGTPWFDPGAHGTCQQRVQAVLQGLNAYILRSDPLASCVIQ